MKRTLTALITVACLSFGAAQAATIAVTGYNHDAIVDAGSISYASTTTAVGWALVQAGYTGPSSGGAGTPLTITGDTVTSLNGTVFAIDPDANNYLKGNGTLTLTTPGQYEDLQFLFYGQNGSLTATLNFADTSSTVLTASPSFADWQTPTGNNAFTLSETATINVGTGATLGLNPREYGVTLSGTDQAKTITSIDFVFSSGGGGIRGGVLAVSGTLVPEPSSILLGGLGSLLLLRRRP